MSRGRAMAAGVAIDALLGDPRRGHPVAGFGRAAAAARAALLGPEPGRPASRTWSCSWAARRSPRTWSSGVSRRGRSAGSALVAATVWATVGGRSLAVEARRVAGLVERGDLDAARRRVPALVGRDPAGLDGAGLCRAAVESVAENTADAVVGPLIWCRAFGAAGAVGYRAANTLDAMVGHRSARYERFGWAAARLDDALSWPAARLGALLACLLAPAVGGDAGRALATLRRDGGRHPSPNAGRMEAAFAGALGVQLGGRLSYGGRIEDRPALGRGRPPGPADVRRAARLSRLVTLACAALLLAAGRR